MSLVLAYATYIFGFVEASLYLGAAYYAYRLTKLAGAFRAWILIITALIILTSHSVADLIQVATQVPFEELVASTDGIPVPSFLLSSFSGTLLSALLFSAMYELHAKFRQLSK